MFRNTCEKLLDYSIYFSFDRSGYLRHQKDFTPLDISELKNKVGIVTGGTSGIGLEVVDFFKKAGTKVYVSSRSANSQNNSEKIKFISLDMSCFKSVKKFCDNFEGKVDYLILNAGGMPESLDLNEFGIESQFASQVIGHYLMFRLLHDQNKLEKGARVIWTASGGMYLTKFDKQFIYGKKIPYDKVATYANAKRAQVILNKMLARKFDVFQAVMHPGWVDTPGVRTAIPGFFKFTKKRLRLPNEGADCINWLVSTKDAIPSGGLWFDRKLRKKVVFPWTKNTKDECDYVLSSCESIYDQLTKG